METKLRKTLVDAAMGRIECELVIKNANIVNVFTKELLKGQVFIKDGFIADVDYEKKSLCKAKVQLDLKGKILAPGLIDAHLHIESSMLTPRNFVKAVLVFGTTTLIVDSHELGNVYGIRGVKYVLDDTKDLPINCYALAPSCVPSVEHKENTGASFYAKEIKTMLDMDRVLGLGEIMDYIGVINNFDRMVSIIKAGQNSFLQGHLPDGRGNILSAYLCAGPVSCHESCKGEEALEKLRKGMYVDAREGSNSKNVKAIVKALPDIKNPPFNLCFCTDDKEASDIIKVGHMNNVVQTAIDAGMPPIEALACASINTAREIALKHLGAIAPSYQADFIVLDDLYKIKPSLVFHKGKEVARNAKLSIEIKKSKLDIEKENSIIIDKLSLEQFILKHDKEKARVNIMSFEDESSMIANKKEDILEVKNNIVCLKKQYNFVAVINRYKDNDNITIAITENIHVKKGAIASSVGHDCHNITVVYKDPKDAFLAVKRLEEIAGGCVAAYKGLIRGEVALPIAGLLSPLEADELSLSIEKYNELLRQDFGINNGTPIMRIFFIALAVIPYIKMTDMGLIDVITQEFIPTIIE